MSLVVDGAAILKAIARNPRAFAMSKGTVDSLATTAVTAKLREKGLTLSALRSIAKSLGPHDFSTIVDGLPARDAKSLARLDAGHPDFASADEHWHRAHIVRLASGAAEPTPAPPASPVSGPAARTTGLPKIGKIMASAAQATAAKARHPKAGTRSGARARGTGR